MNNCMSSSKFTPLLLVFCALALMSAARAADWVSTGGPIGGLGYDVRIHPQQKSRMYVTDNFAGVVRSDDGGANWRAVNQGISVRGGPTSDWLPIFSLTMDPNNPSILWAGTNAEGSKYGVFKSTDGGDNWTLKATGISSPTPQGLVFRGFTIQPGNSNVVYAMAEVPSAIQGLEFNRVQGLVYKTVDGGESWSRIWLGDNLARYLIVDPENNLTLYLSTGIFDREAYNSDCANGNYAGVGVLKSSDGGVTWTAINSGLSNLYVGALRMHPAKSQVLFAAVGNNSCSGGYVGNQQGGLFRTLNGGSNWSKVISGDILTTVNFAPANPDVVYAGSAAAFYRSADGGATWSRYAKTGANQWGPEGVRPGVPIDVVVDPADVNLLYANNYGGGVFRSSDGAQSWAIWSKGYSGAWVHAVHVPPASSSTVLAIGRSGPFRSVNYGGDWTGITTGQATDLAEWNTLISHPRDARVILMSDEHQGTILRSSDGGASFKRVFTHPQANAANITTRQGIKAFAAAPSAPDTIYAGMARERGGLERGETPAGRVMLKSADGGASFVSAGAGLDGSNVRKLVVHPLDPNTLWAASSSGLYRSSDAAATWTLLGLGSKNIVALAVDSANNVLVASEKEAGIWFSENGGASWSGPATVGFSNPNPYVMALVFADTGTLYAADQYSGVYSSTDHGRTWTPFPDAPMTGLTVRTPLDVTYANGMLYVATQGGGVFRYGNLPSASAPYSITGAASGTLRARALAVTLQPTLAELGASRQIFIVGVLGTQVVVLSSTGWQAWSGGSLPAYLSGPISTQIIRIFDGSIDLSAAIGAKVYVGYGTDDAEMVTNGRFALVHTVQ